MTQLLDRVNEARKAIVAAAAPGITLLIADVTDAVSDQTAGVVAVLAALVLTLGLTLLIADVTDAVSDQTAGVVAVLAALVLTLLIADVTDAVSDQTAGVVAALVLTYLVPNQERAS